MRIPKDWLKVTLDDLAHVQTGIAKGKKDIKDPVFLPYLRVANVQDGFVDLTELKSIEISEKEVSRYLLQSGDVLMTEGGDFDKLGRGTVWDGRADPCLHQNHVFVVRCNSDRLLPHFLSWQASSRYGRDYFLSCSKQTTNLASINSSQLKQFPVLLPPLPEQQRIAEILSTWDSAIEQTEKLIQAKERRKKALMQQLLTGKRRFKEFKGKKWRYQSLGEISEEITARNNGHHTLQNVRAVNKTHGMIPMKAETIGKSLERYKVVEPKDFAYNPMRINIGSICRWESSERCLVSPDYVVFRTKPDLLESDYLNHFRQSHRWEKFMERAGAGGVRIRIYYNHLAEMTIPLPPTLAEQRKIAAVLNTADQELDQLKDQLAALRRQKQGLLQVLLTGKVRVRNLISDLGSKSSGADPRGDRVREGDKK